MKIQRLMFKENLRAAGLVTLLGLASCAIDNDIPYPLVEGTISEIVTEGLRASEDGTVASGVDIDRSARTVTLYVNDSVDVSRLRLTRLILDPRDATIELDSARCDDKEKFPFHDFASLDSLSLSANTRLDLSTPLELNVRTYQDNPWNTYRTPDRGSYGRRRRHGGSFGRSCQPCRRDLRECGSGSFQHQNSYA